MDIINVYSAKPLASRRNNAVNVTDVCLRCLRYDGEELVVSLSYVDAVELRDELASLIASEERVLNALLKAA